MNHSQNTMMIYGYLVDGNLFEVSPITGKELIHRLWTDDYGVPPSALIMETKTKDGKRVKIVVPFGSNLESYATIEEATQTP